MATISGQPSPAMPSGDGAESGDGPDVRVVQIPEQLWLAGAMRLLPESAGDPTMAAQRFLESAQALNIDLGLMYGTLSPDGQTVREVCLGVLGSGRTGMLFVSSPAKKTRAWSGVKLKDALAPGGAARTDNGHRERIASIQHVCRVMSEVGPAVPKPVRLAQALLDAREKDVGSALRSAGFLDVGELAYMRRNLPRTGPSKDFDLDSQNPWPSGIRVASVDELIREGHSPQEIDDWLCVALDKSYADTLDCPELCGMRETPDVLESHRAVGQYDPSLWWIVLENGVPEGCQLFNVSQEHDSVELVYVGLSPKIRGKGIGSSLLAYGILSLYKHSIGESARGPYPVIRGSGGLTCAVDTRNRPALQLYKRMGFTKFGQRWPLVARLTPGVGIAPIP
jgi:ribosomal protein S18 acetylase RimI-like enzyme